MKPAQIRRYLELAAEHGADHAARLMEAEAEESRYEREADDLAAAEFERDAYGCDNGPCTQDDQHDSRGERLRPRVNDAGEPWWM
jgi:hypothetical protein